MPATPLSHHEILQLVEPFTRCGLQVDLSASRRQDRCLVFKPVQHAGQEPGAPTLHETLELEHPGPGRCKLTRRLTWTDAPGQPGGLQATLEVRGAQPAELLRQVQGIAPALHFARGQGWLLLRDFTLPAGAADAASLQLVRGIAFAHGQRLSLTLPPTRRIAAELALTAPQGELPEFPEDLLAVLGWDWARLVKERQGWTSKLRLRGSPSRRSAAAVAALDLAAEHLATTLAGTPGQFHDRHAAARRFATLRRAIPALTGLLLLAAVALAPRFGTPERPGAWILLFHLPTALFALSFCLQELPRLEIPPWPRRSSSPSWWPAARSARQVDDRPETADPVA
jgi:hypothetical protein